jgi:hypothetical protein
MTRLEFTVGGFDLASVSSGVVYVRGVWDGNTVSIEALQERAYKIENHFVSHYECAKLMLGDSLAFKQKYGLDLCAIEDYTMQSLSMVSFSIGEVGGLVRGFHFDAGFPLLLNKPVVMRSFAADGRKLPKGAPGKRALVTCAVEDFNYTSGCRYAKERSDCCDAFLHACMGVLTLMFLAGVPLDVISPKRQDIWRNKKCTGILDNLDVRLLYPVVK